MATQDFCAFSWAKSKVHYRARNGGDVTSDVKFVPEFSSLITLSLFMIATLLAVTVYRRKHSMKLMN